MSDVACPCCKKGVQSRHTYMAAMPATVVCTGCGSWFSIDAVNSGGWVWAVLLAGTLVSALFWPMALILLPVYMVIATGASQRFSVELIKMQRADLWTISRETGDIEPLNGEEAEQRFDETLMQRMYKLKPAQRSAFMSAESVNFREKTMDFRSLRRKAYRAENEISFTEKFSAQVGIKNGSTQVTH